MMHVGMSGAIDNVEFVAVAPVNADFSVFFAQHKRDMMRLGFLLTGSSSQAEEAVQDAFVQVLRRWAQIDDPGAYLRRAVVNRCASWHRHRAVVWRTRSRVARDESYLDQPNELADALSLLSARRRAVVVLRYYERLELSEIAAELGISVGTVKSTLHRALAELKGILSNES
jgi:RNA polymerase sigma-70 factor (sigma-E family)